MRKALFIGAFVIFMLGFVSSIVIGSYFLFDKQDFSVTHNIATNTKEDAINNPLTINNKDALIEQVSPYNWIKEENIHVTDDGIVIDLPNARWAKFTDTNSMDPVLDADANAIEIIPKSITDIHMGDIVSYKSNLVSGTIIHRVVKISHDIDGWYVTLKGDNNPKEDPERVRFDMIQRVVVAIIY